jgi:hypothetical protein
VDETGPGSEPMASVVNMAATKMFLKGEGAVSVPRGRRQNISLHTFKRFKATRELPVEINSKIETLLQLSCSS